ncbi:Uma2 family endonuclease [Trichothermofontia sp.]
MSAKTRPVLIVQADNLHTGLSQVIVAEEYLELEVNSDTRNEYCNGEIIPMTGGTPNHNDIAGNLYILLKSSLRGKEYRTFYVDQRLWIPSVNLYTYD